MKRLHHMAWCFEPENMDDTKARWQERLRTTLSDFPVPTLGMRVMNTPESGIEIIAPIGDGAVGQLARRFLDAHGEGLFSITFEVDDLENVVSEAESAGAKVVFHNDWVTRQGPEAARTSYVMFDDLLGVHLAFQQTTPVNGEPIA